MKVLRTPDERFEGLVDYPFEAHYTTISTEQGVDLRIHHVDEGPADGPVLLCMHGQPVWSYLYRKMIPRLVEAGVRVIAPDLVGYGKSDKPAAREDYTYQRQVDWMGAWLAANDFRNLTFFGQDWGGLIGLRMIVDAPDRFDRVVISNTGLPYNPDLEPEVVDAVKQFRAEAPTPSLPAMGAALRKMGDNGAMAFAHWQKYCWETEDPAVGFMLASSVERPSRWRMLLSLARHRLGLGALRIDTPVGRAYEAPFPTPAYKMGVRAMPSQVPMLPDDPSLQAQANAWSFYERFEKPFLCAFADNDPVTAGGEAAFIERVPGARGQPHTTIRGGGHFVQEMQPQAVTQVIVDFIHSTGG